MVSNIFENKRISIRKCAVYSSLSKTNGALESGKSTSFASDCNTTSVEKSDADHIHLHSKIVRSQKGGSITVSRTEQLHNTNDRIESVRHDSQRSRITEVPSIDDGDFYVLWCSSEI